jgi:ADP-heptose:LPS heptosyltransferase
MVGEGVKMRIIDVVKAFNQGNKKFEAGHKYVLAEDIESQYRSVSGDCLGMSYPIENVYRPYKGQPLDNKRLMTWRTGGQGDLHFLLPVLRHIKKKYPTCYLKVATGCREPLENVPEIDELHDMPFNAKLLDDCDWHLQYQGIIEAGSEASRNVHAVDLFFSYFGIDSTQFPVEEKRPKLFFKEEEMAWRNKTLPSMNVTPEDYVIGIQMETSSPLRNFPKDKMKTIIDILAREENVKIILIGAEQQTVLGQFFKGNNHNIFVATKFSVRQSIILATRYDLIISPDTFMVQTAGALEKPLIGLYGPFPSSVRMKYFKNAIGIEPSVVCSPCYKHDFRACIKGFPSPCFSQVTIEDVLQAVDYQKAKFSGGHFKYMSQSLTAPDLSEIEKYMMSADKGLCFFGGHYSHPNVSRVDSNPFVKADITDLNTEFKREAFPFILYMGPVGFNAKNKPCYEGTKGLVRPGGHYIVYTTNTDEAFFSEVQKDLGKNFILLHTKFDPARRLTVIVGKKPY